MPAYTYDILIPFSIFSKFTYLAANNNPMVELTKKNRTTVLNALLNHSIDTGKFLASSTWYINASLAVMGMPKNKRGTSCVNAPALLALSLAIKQLVSPSLYLLFFFLNQRSDT